MTEYQKGDRVALVRCNDEYTRLTPGELGTVQRTDDVGTVHVKWDSGASLGIVEEAGDRIRPAHEGFGLRLTLSTDNAAFTEDRGAEVARILRRLADACERGGYTDGEYHLHDVNGNTVGRVDWKRAVTRPADYDETVRQEVERLHAEYNAETARLIAAGETDEMSRAMSRPRVCHSCARVWPGGGYCTGTPEHPHREIKLYASND